MSGTQLPVYSVSQVNGYLKELVDGDPLLRGLLVRGEVSNYKCYPSGHHYFSLKDEQGSIRCVMFRGDAARLRFKPVNGLSVIAYGRVSVYPRDGQYQLYCTQLMEDGRGALDRAFEELKKKLEAQGLFDPAKKQPLPAYPRRIALVTSPAGAAVRDMIRILRQRWPLTEVLVVPVRVQGEGAAEEIAAAIHQVNNRDDIDLIITGAIMAQAPGLVITNFMRDVMAGDMMSGLVKLAEALLTGAGIALGTGVALSLVNAVWGVL